MMDPFHGKLNGMGTANDRVRITLDGDTGDILVGGHGRGGDLVLTDDAGISRIRLEAGGVETDPPAPGSPSTGANRPVEISTDTISLAGATGTIRAGGNGQTGTMELKPSSGGGGMTLTGAGHLTIQPPIFTSLPISS